MSESLQLDPATLETWLNWAGRKFLALPSRSALPQGFKSFWPKYDYDEVDLETALHVKLRAEQAPKANELDYIEQILSIPALCVEIKHRRVLQYRTIIDPISGKHIYNWSRIAKQLKTSRQNVRNWYEVALRDACGKVEENKVCRLAQFFSSLDL